MLCWRKNRPERGFMIAKSTYRVSYPSNCNSIRPSYAAVYKSLCRLKPANLMNEVTIISKLIQFLELELIILARTAKLKHLIFKPIHTTIISVQLLLHSEWQ